LSGLASRRSRLGRTSTYRLYDTSGGDLGLLEHPAPTVGPGDVLLLADGREAIVTAQLETRSGQLAGFLEVAIASGEAEEGEEPDRDRPSVGERLLLGIEELVLQVLTWPLLWVAFVVTMRRKTQRG
jgi:hypothetical protein